MDGKRDVRTYRVRQLPQHIDALETSKLLVSLDPRLGPVYNVKVLSLGRGISPWERPPTKTATIMFQSLPTCLDSDDTVWTLPGREHGYHRDVLIDVHFLDFTVLCEPPKALHDSPTYDCIAISGLASHPFGSWRTRKQLDFMWLRDQLPQDFQNIRPILYGFNSILTGHTSFQNIDDLASSLVAKLRSVGRQSFSANPIIFLAHSLGGIVLKRALLYLASGTDRDQVILKKVAAVIFFGVPNKGMDINNLLSIVSEEGTDHTLVSELGPSSPFLNDLEKQYNGIASLKNIRIVSVYETKKSPLVQIGMDGKLHRTDTHAVLVDRESARHSNSQQHDVFAINEDHSNMVKFSRDDENYRLIASCIYDLVNTADSSSSSYPSENTENLLQPGLTPETHLPAEIVRQPHWNHVHPSLQHFETFRHHLPKQHPGHLASKDEAWRLYVLYIHETMMASLELDEVAAREEAVSNAYESTFDWVFTDSKLGFRRWLQSANNVFWIAGKPGSGKSTLMKYIWHDARTQKTLGTSDRDVKLLKAKFFFHDRGSYAQKSFEGLLQSIIHQLLLQEPILKESVETVFIKRALTYQRPWSLEELEGAFDNILTQKTARVHIFLHLDALDEYDGSKEVLCHFIQKTTTLLPDSYTQIGICFASRPWNIFNDYFGQSPGLKIHEHTSKDMRTYAKAKIESRPPLHKLIKSLKRTPKHLTYESILTGIVSKAQGVFLWVALMIEDLLKQSSDGLRVESIPHILQSMPDRLEDFYERIVSKIPQEYRVETYVMLESVLRTRGNLSLRGLAMTLECAQPGSEHFPTCMDLCRLSMDTFDPENMARLVSSRCGGLLEVVQVNRPAKARSNDDLKFLFQLTNNTEDGEKEESLDSYVQFMHQTVKDYMRNPGLLQSIISHDSMRTINSGNGNTFLFRSCIVDKSCYYNGDFVHYGRAAEATTGISQRVFIDSVDRVSLMTSLRYFGLQHWQTVPTDTMHWRIVFASIAGLQLYVHEVTKELGSVATQLAPSLLHCIAAATFQPMSAPGGSLRSRRTELVQHLLQHGGDLPRVYENVTALQIAFERPPDESDNQGKQTELEEIVFHLIQHGHSPNQRVHHGLTFTSETGERKPGDRELAYHARGATRWSIECTPLHVLTMSSNESMLKVLLEHGARVNELDERGATPLDWILQTERDLVTTRHGSRGEKLMRNALLLIKHGAVPVLEKSKAARFWQDMGDRIPLEARALRFNDGSVRGQ